MEWFIYPKVFPSIEMHYSPVNSAGDIRYSSRRKDPLLLEQLLRGKGLKVERVSECLDGEVGYYLRVQGDHSIATLKPAVAYQVFKENNGPASSLSNHVNDEKIQEILQKEYNKEWPYLRNWGIGASIAATYTLVSLTTFLLLQNDCTVSLLLSSPFVITMGQIIGIVLDRRRYTNNNIPWISNEIMYFI